jgi:hypothetical protein
MVMEAGGMPVVAVPDMDESITFVFIPYLAAMCQVSFMLVRDMGIAYN